MSTHDPENPDERREPAGLDTEELEHLLTRVQDGVVSRRQLRELGARDHDIVRLVRRRDLVAVHPGVYVGHTGTLTWVQRAWVAVPASWPAALSHQSAFPNPPNSGLTHVLEQAAIDVGLGKALVADRFQVFADACQTRETTPAAIADALTTRRRVPGRSFLVELLHDLDTGACSVLERGYLDLERLHGLPEASRQRADHLAGRTIYRDASYADLGVKIELDGQAFHDNAAARDRDAERDLDTWSLTARQPFG